MSASPLVSVVTPVYNGERYLAECIESVRTQSWGHWEYVIVENCSTDRTSEIAEAYARRDPRIRVHRNAEFLKLLPNWNHALRQISGESRYCKVVHADDRLFPHCLEEMVAAAEASPRIGLVGACGLREKQVVWHGLPCLNGGAASIFSGRQVCRSVLLGGPHVFGTPTSLLIRSELIRLREAFYNEENLHADTEACFDLLQESDFAFVHQVLTQTRLHADSVTSFARRLNTVLTGNLIILKQYGPVYLSDREYQARLRYRLHKIYHFLAYSFLVGREPAFWEYQRRQLEKAGQPFSRLRLVLALLRLVPQASSYLWKSALRRLGSVT